MTKKLLHRRHFLSSAAALGMSAALFPVSALANASSQKRFIFIMLRGALDGLAAVAPVGDPGLANLKGRDTDFKDYFKVDTDFALHPALKNLHRFYKEDDAIILPAIAAPYRTRSHFDAQDLLELGAEQKDGTRTGWVARMTNLLPGNADKAVALTGAMPIALQGTDSALAWAPDRIPDASDDLYVRLEDLYQSNPEMAAALDTARKSDAIANDMEDAMTGRGRGNRKQAFVNLANAAANFLTAENGPRLAMLELSGWDTHFAQGRRLTQQLDILDSGIAALKAGLNTAWDDTCIFVMSEFGRTARFNGSNGTDHGTATTGFLLGGSVKGGSVKGEWPGLSKNQLFDDRDLFPANNAYDVVAAIGRDHLGLSRKTASDRLFPGQSINPLMGLFG